MIQNKSILVSEHIFQIRARANNLVDLNIEGSDVLVHDPVASKESWSRLLRKPATPLCEHSEPCKSMLTRKKGENQGRSFWMCQRPLGPSGNKEKGTQWRCSTFIWSSDWKGDG